MLTNEYLFVGDGTSDAALMYVTANRSIGSTIIEVDTLAGVPDKFIGTSGTLDANGFIDPDTVTNFYGHINGSDLEIDGFIPGSSDEGNTEGQVIVIKPNTAWANLVAEFLNELPPDIVKTIAIEDEAVEEEKIADMAVTFSKLSPKVYSAASSTTGTSSTTAVAAGTALTMVLPAGQTFLALVTGCWNVYGNTNGQSAYTGIRKNGATVVPDVKYDVVTALQDKGIPAAQSFLTTVENGDVIRQYQLVTGGFGGFHTGGGQVSVIIIGRTA